MRKLTPLFVSGLLMFAIGACTDARTSQQAPDNAQTQAQNSNGDSTVANAPSKEEAQNTQGDATSDVRKDQLNSDIRAREQRNNATGGDAMRADGDLESEVRSKLEANLPASALTVDSKDGAVSISGTVPTKEQYDRIETLAKEIKGVQSVAVDVRVAQATTK
ncbi:MAG: hypothetical protein N5P05_001764 [Chroococcopsis gigantea SAG 12.99]|jgi:hyperosmotically inducible protein|nr:hypothetical protein [Chroococcopsis gigantea SAG 12.99]